MTSRRVLPLLLALFVASGCAALIYEIVWFELLQLVIGSSAISLSILLGTFMGGMCLGSLMLPRAISARHHPLRVYALLELGIGVIGILVLVGMPLIDGVYTAWAGAGLASVVLRGIAAAICLLPPTLLMGATLPAIARWVETTPQGVAWLGFFYGGNITGAVIGSLLAGFYLLRAYDVTDPNEVEIAGGNADHQVVLTDDSQYQVELVFALDLAGFDVLDDSGPMIGVDHRFADCKGHIVMYPFRNVQLSTARPLTCQRLR